MSELNASNLRKEQGNEGPDLVGVTELTSPYFMVPPSGTTEERPQNPQKGTLRFNTDIGSLEYFKGDALGWEGIVKTTPNLNGGARGLAMGGRSTPDATCEVIQYITISTLSNSIDFGDLGTGIGANVGCASRTRAISAGGSTSPALVNTMEYVTIATTVMLVSKGYPEKYEKGFEISNLEGCNENIVFHAGTKIENKSIKTNGGRVLAVTSFGKDMQHALRKSYLGAEKINFTGKNYRKDIGFDL